MSKELTISKSYDIAKPGEVVDMASILKKHVIDQKLYTTIAAKNYVQVEGWQFAGGLMGLYPRVATVENLSKADEIKWRADVELVRLSDDKIISRGFAICSSKELKKKGFDEYAILSMAQTRAVGKAYRNIVGWVMKLAGYEGTPSEEMGKFGEESKAFTPKEKTAPKTRNEQKTTIQNECHQCASPITEAEAKFSKIKFKKPLCRECQKGASV